MGKDLFAARLAAHPKALEFSNHTLQTDKAAEQLAKRFGGIKLTKLPFFIMLLFPAVAFAQVYDVQSTGEYVMGDSDTKVEARKIALDHAKQLAVEKIGTYIETRTEVINYQLTKDEITTYTSAIIKTSVISENVRLLEDKTTVFTISINASIDIGVLSNKLNEIKDDSKRREQLRNLQAENTKLQKELESVTTLLKNSQTTDIGSLRKQREVLFEKIDSNRNSITVAFEKGTLLNLAMRNRNELADIKNNVDDFLRYIINNIEITMGKPQVKYRGELADLIIDVKWTLKKQYVLIKPAEVSMEKGTVSPAVFQNFLQDEAKKIHAFPIYKMDGHYLDLKLSGINEQEISTCWMGKSLAMNIKAGNFTEKIILKNKQKSEITISDSKRVIFPDIPISQLENIMSVDAKLIVDEPQETAPLKKKGMIVPKSN